MVMVILTATPSSGTADDDSTRRGADHNKKATTMKTAKAKQSRCGVKDDNIGSNLGDSKHHTVALLTMAAAVETNTPSNDSQHSNAGLTATAQLAIIFSLANGNASISWHHDNSENR